MSQGVVLTATQVRAVQRLHTDGYLGYRTSDETQRVLLEAGLAVWRDTVLQPLVNVWADGHGLWHVAVPVVVTNQEDVARAVIRGELAAREEAGRGVQVKVARDELNTATAALVWREV